MINLNHLKGIIGELYTILFLLLRGYRLIKWRYNSKFGEIDLILKHKNIIIFTEVKTRIGYKNSIDISQIISYKQIDRIRNSAQNFMHKHQYKYDTFDYKIQASIIISFLRFPIIYDID